MSVNTNCYSMFIVLSLLVAQASFAQTVPSQAEFIQTLPIETLVRDVENELGSTIDFDKSPSVELPDIPPLSEFNSPPTQPVRSVSDHSVDLTENQQAIDELRNQANLGYDAILRKKNEVHRQWLEASKRILEPGSVRSKGDSSLPDRKNDPKTHRDLRQVKNSTPGTQVSVMSPEIIQAAPVEPLVELHMQKPVLQEAVFQQSPTAEVVQVHYVEARCPSCGRLHLIPAN